MEEALKPLILALALAAGVVGCVFFLQWNTIENEERYLNAPKVIISPLIADYDIRLVGRERPCP